MSTIDTSGCQAETMARGVLVCFAVPAEAARFRPDPVQSCRILITGMGKDNASAAVSRALRSGAPRRVLTCGFAGGLNPDLRVGDVLFDAGPELARPLADLGARAGTFHCAPTIAVSVADKQRLREESGADAVEMESGVIRALCRERGIEAATVRVISDEASTALPLDFNSLCNVDGNISYVRLAGALARSPGAIPPLLKFQRDLAQCSRRLAAVLHGLFARTSQTARD
jgi:adenosylhomocysteine nucleosidase